MKKTIEKYYLLPFLPGGVAYRAIDWLRDEYGLGRVAPADFKGAIRQGDALPGNTDTWPEEWRMAHKCSGISIDNDFSRKPEGTNSYVKKYWNEDWDSLFSEIEDNLKECKTESEKERYLYSLMSPFADFAAAFYPFGELEEIENGTNTNNPEWVKYVSRQFFAILDKIDYKDLFDPDPTPQVIAVLKFFVDSEKYFANRLDSLLLTYGIDLLRLQRESGLYLLEKRDVLQLEQLLGSMKIVQKYINELPKVTTSQIKDFANRFVDEHSEDDAREMLNHILPLTKSQIGDYLSMCRDCEKIIKETSPKHLHQWLQNNGYNVGSLRIFQDHFKKIS